MKMKAIVLAILLSALYGAVAHPQTTTNCQAWGTNITCQSTDNGYTRQYYDRLEANRRAQEQAGQQMGALMGRFLAAPAKVVFVYTLKGTIRTISVCEASNGSCAPPVQIPTDISPEDYGKVVDMLSRAQNVHYINADE
jgi:hypothetical protein